ncbi:hypothetical protein BCM02_115106 [Paenibacillus methanolicus]|uniref:Uncharacterized protein n=1 Tax=Paenibacillus methanolicus TaxID=582686 RepID=A0A5S5BR86_9BACL|nr:hypothetical protein BCM02_115106 [Paenibacillus methanolicus]
MREMPRSPRLRDRICTRERTRDKQGETAVAVFCGEARFIPESSKLMYAREAYKCLEYENSGGLGPPLRLYPSRRLLATSRFAGIKNRSRGSSYIV